MPAHSDLVGNAWISRFTKQAREAAQPLRRSVAGQVAYGATLGRIVEHSGLTAQEAHTAIANYALGIHRARSASTQAPSQVDAVLAQFTVVEADGSLAQRVRQVVAKNRSKARGQAA